MAVLWAQVEAHKAYVGAHEAHVEAHKAHVEAHKAYVEVHKGYVELHKAYVEVHRTLGTYRNPRKLSHGKVQRLSKRQYIRLVLLYLLTCCPSPY